MNRCTLCGGPLGSDGRCRDCGLDNTKNDKKYRLNTHNEKTARLHHGDCEDNLNTDHGWSSPAAKKGKPGKAAEKKASAIPNEKRVTGKTAAKTNGEKDSYEQFGTVRKNTKKVKERHATGTVKKKRGPLSRVARWIIILYLINFALSAVFGVIEDADLSGSEIADFLENIFGEMDFESGWEDDISVTVDEVSIGEEEQKDVMEAPEEKMWDTQDEGYFEAELSLGIYTAGYDIPAGTYQVYCPEESAWLHWQNPSDDYSQYECLFSKEEQENYQEVSDDGTCPYFEYSGLIDLEEGGVIYVQDTYCDLLLRGIGDGRDSLKEHEPQMLAENVMLENGMEAGKDFEAGVYDLVLNGEDIGVSITIHIEESDSTYYIYLMEGCETFYHFPFTDGNKIELEVYGADVAENECVKLVPSY